MAPQPGTAERIAERIDAGLTRLAAALDSVGVALSAGQHQPVGPVSEVVGVGTVPAARRRGLGLAVTAALVADARARGAELVFLTASDADVARLYGRLRLPHGRDRPHRGGVGLTGDSPKKFSGGVTFSAPGPSLL